MLNEPSQQIKEQIYKFYIQIFESSFDVQKKKNLLTSIAGWEEWSWRVVGISVRAVGKILDQKGHARVKSELVRDHFFQGRSVTYNNMLKTKLNFEDYWKEFWDNDRTILMTKDEHNKISTDKFTGLWENISDKVFEIDWKLGNFKSNKVAGFHFTKQKEGIFVLQNFEFKVEKKTDNSNSGEEFYYVKKKGY
ncbi:hypothetical protein [Candidatus Pelagibacter communis]|jgi:hypothetical protein|uniref:hypothetical protein n=1 Tax=Pelagibacter ubique TaxID=198252 RepID=UPI00094CABFB|nr:hypothetical protein [Candidatus Pelagibacter ubique]|tara:strand:- start:74 stop:652 length:579 start_codon:yes stop_codon:yes gene_type:complete